MPLELLVTLGVFAPLLGAAIAGFFGRRIGDVPSQAITTGLLFVSCAVAWTVFSQWTWGHLEPFTVTVSPFINVGDFQSNWSIRIDALSAVMLVVVTTVSSLVHLYSWGYMAEDDVEAAVLCLSVAVHLCHAGAGYGRRLHAAVLRLGRGGAGVLSADRLLV